MKNKGQFLIAVILILLPILTAQAEYRPFAIVSDSHIGLSDTIYKAIIGKIDDQGIKKVIHTGDAIHTYGSAGQWERFLAVTGQGKTLMLAPGNHDVRSKESYKVSLRFFPQPYYSDSEGDTLFLLLNTSIPGEEHRITGDQLKWLKAELQRSFRYKFVFLHEPPYPVVPFHGIDRNRVERDELHQLFVENGVSLVVAGHDHYYKRVVKDGIAYIVMGATGGRLTLFEHNGDFFCYVLANRTDEGYSFTVKDLRGNVRDEFSVDEQNHPTEDSQKHPAVQGSSQVSYVRPAVREIDFLASVRSVMHACLRFFGALWARPSVFN